MDLRATLLAEHSRAQSMKIVQYVGKNQKRFDDLVDLFLTNEYRISQRAATALGHCCDVHPHLIQPHIQHILENLKNENTHDGVKRNSIRVLQEIDIPEDLMGLAADICFDYLMDPKVAVAIRVFSMSVLFNICKKEPELSNELKLVIEEHYEHGTAGFKVRARRVLKGLAKL